MSAFKLRPNRKIEPGRAPRRTREYQDRPGHFMEKQYKFTDGSWRNESRRLGNTGVKAAKRAKNNKRGRLLRKRDRRKSNPRLALRRDAVTIAMAPLHA